MFSSIGLNKSMSQTSKLNFCFYEYQVILNIRMHSLSRIKQKHSKLKLTKLNILIILFKNFVDFSKTLLIFNKSSSEKKYLEFLHLVKF